MPADHRATPDVPNLDQFLTDLLVDSAPTGYIDRELARADAMRTPVGTCETCGSTIHKLPGHCSLCAWDAS